MLMHITRADLLLLSNANGDAVEKQANERKKYRIRAAIRCAFQQTDRI